MKTSFRELFLKLNLILCCCILTTALTGIILGISNRFISLPKIVIQGLIAIHNGALLGDNFADFYVLFLGLGVFVLGANTVITEKYTVLFAKNNSLIVNFYAVISLILVIPLVVCVQTGLADRLNTNISGVSFLTWHSGSNLPPLWNVVYTMATGIFLTVLSVLNFKHPNSINLPSQFWQNFCPQLKKIYLVKISGFQSTAGEKSNFQRLCILSSLVILCSILYYSASKLFIAIFMSIIIFVLLALYVFKELLGSPPKQKLENLKNKLVEEEHESITMLKAIPDSILRLSQDGICLSYMPALDTKYFVLEGDIINRHITEFIEPTIALGLIKALQISLKTGTTQNFRFAIAVDHEDKHHEARVTAIGTSEVLVLVREISYYQQHSKISNQENPEKNIKYVELFTEPDLVQALEKALEQIEHNSEIQTTLVCLALKASNDMSHLELDVLRQISIKVSEVFPDKDIFQVQNNNLIMLVSDKTMEQISTLVSNLNHDLNKMLSIWQKDSINKIESSICLLEVNQNSADALSLINTVQVTCQMAKQKVKLKTF